MDYFLGGAGVTSDAPGGLAGAVSLLNVGLQLLDRLPLIVKRDAPGEEGDCDQDRDYRAEFPHFLVPSLRSRARRSYSIVILPTSR